jgi:hypothetical protein
MNKTIEEIFIEYLSSSLPLFEKKTVAYRFQCPYCQSSGKTSKGKDLAPSEAKGNLYPVGNTWNFRCPKCEKRQSFEKFLEAQVPLLHFEYVRLRDQLGTTGFQTNCPNLETLLKKRGVLGDGIPDFRPVQLHERPVRRTAPVAAPSAPPSPKVTKLPPMRSPQQQAGCQSRLNHQVKQRQQRRRQRPL